jgi:hypothetical protein
MSKFTSYFKTRKSGYILVQQSVADVSLQLAQVCEDDLIEKAQQNAGIFFRQLVYYFNIRSALELILRVDVSTNEMKLIALFLGPVVKLFLSKEEYLPTRKNISNSAGEMFNADYRDDWIKIMEFNVDEVETARELYNKILERFENIRMNLDKESAVIHSSEASEETFVTG